MKISTLTFLLTICFSKNIYSQMKISGQIKDEKNNSIEFIEVQLKGNDSQMFKSELTDADGKFFIETEKGKYTLTVKKLGVIYDTQNIQIKKDTVLGIIYINEKNHQLQEIIISQKKPIFKQDFDKLIFNVENSSLKQGFDALEVLKRSPKLQVNAAGDILLRNNSVLVLISGRKINLSGQELTNYLSSINSENIKNIEIQTVGNASTDASNSGGVININLKQQAKGFQTTFKNFYILRDKQNDVIYSGINNQFGSAKWNVYNKFDFRDDENKYIFASITNFNNTNAQNANNGYSNNKTKTFNTTTGIVFYPNRKNELGIEFYLSKNNTARNGSEFLNAFNPNLFAVAENIQINNSKILTWFSTINYTFKIDSIGSNLKIVGDFGNNKFDNANKVDTRYSFGLIDNNKNQFLTNAKSIFANFQTDWINKMPKDLEINFGIKSLNFFRSNEFVNLNFQNNNLIAEINAEENFNNQETILANYLSLSKKWNKTNSLKIGLRTEYTNLKGQNLIENTAVKQSYFDFFPSLFYSYQLSSTNIVSFSYSKRIQRPSFRDLNPFVIKQNDFLFQKGNPNLQPQYTHKIDVSYQLKKQTLSLYTNFTNDIIAGVYSIDGNVSFYQPKNFGKERQIGIDHSFYGDLNKWLYANFTTEFWNYQFELQDLKPIRFAFSNSLNMNFKFSKTLFVDVSQFFISTNQFQVTKTAKQYKLDLALQKNIFKSAGLARIVLEDVFDTFKDKNLSTYQNFDFQFFQKRITRSWTFLFIYTFKNSNKFNTKAIDNKNDNKSRL